MAGTGLTKLHRRRHLSNLFSRSYEVFVAACISRAVTAVIDVAAPQQSQALSFFLYALFFAHAAAVAIVFLLPNSSLFDYFFFVACENAGFAWKESTSVLVLSLLNRLHDGLGLAWLGWISLVFFGSLFVYITNLVIILTSRGVATPRMAAVTSNIRDLNSEAFSLSLGFSFTLLVCFSLYSQSSTTYLAGNNDDASVDAGDASARTSWLFLCYCLLATIAAYFLHSQQGPMRGTASLIDGDAEAQTAVRPFSSRNPSFDTDEEAAEQSFCQKAKASCELMLFWFDAKGLARQAQTHFHNTTLGYTVACAWYAYAVLTFQRYFLDIKAGRIFGLFLYAAIVTVVMVRLMTWLSVREERRPQKRKYASVFLVTGRLLVGWSWSEFVTEAFSACIPASPEHNLVGAVSKSLIALVALSIGAVSTLYWRGREAAAMGGGDGEGGAPEGSRAGSGDSLVGNVKLVAPLLTSHDIQ
jgi:hypothetical protein